MHRGEFFGWLITVFMLTFSTRLVSLTPEPFKAISIIFSAVPEGIIRSFEALPKFSLVTHRANETT